MLCFDEMSIKEDITFNKTPFKFDEFVNLGKDNDNLKEGKVADHGLVFMFRPLLDSWVQPIYASASAASGEDLQRLLIKALIQINALIGSL